MLYWSEFVGASVFAGRKKIGHIENIMLDPEHKVITGFLLERRNRDLRYRYFSFTQVLDIKREYILVKEPPEIKLLSGELKKDTLQAENFIRHSVMDEKEEWIGKVVDFGFEPKDGFLKEIILSGSVIEDLWYGRKRMPVLSNVEFSGELVHIDQDAREEITSLHKGLYKLFEMNST